MKPLTEQDIKKIALRYLRAYYRYRPFEGQVVASLDMQGEGGIVADGYLSFQEKGGKNFLATFEATSYGTQQEVRYEIQRQQLRWDAAAVAFVLASGVLLGKQIVGYQVAAHYPFGYALLAVMVVWLAFFMIYIGVFRKIGRYRYIYAVEQFKQYHANEQWIAIGDDVFPSLEDPYYKELRRQCVKNGFGMLLIDREEHSRVLVTPARVEVFQHRRRSLVFESILSVAERMREVRKMPALKRLTQDWFNLHIWGANISRFLRLHHFPRPFVRQLGISTTSVFLMAILLYIDWQHRPIHYVNERFYVRQMEKKATEKKREALEFIVDVPPIPFDSIIPPSFELVYEQNDAVADFYLNPESSIALITVSLKDRWVTYYDCSRFLENLSGRYIIRDRVVPNMDAAKERLSALRQAGVPANALWQGCYDNENSGYLVFLDLIQPDSLEALRRMKIFNNRLKKNSVPAALKVERVATTIKD